LTELKTTPLSLTTFKSVELLSYAALATLIISFNRNDAAVNDNMYFDCRLIYMFTKVFTGTSRSWLNFSRCDFLGTLFPAHHFETVTSDTPNLLAIQTCLMPLVFSSSLRSIDLRKVKFMTNEYT